jgi:uncharacterized phage-like protein YoqJ
MLKVAVIGSRQYPLPLLVRAFVRRLGKRLVSVEVISGGAKGVDTWAAEEAQSCGLSVKVFNADWETHGRSAGMLRNSFLIRQADLIVAFWDEQSPGSRDSIRKALQWGKRIKVFGADGEPIPVEKLSLMVK